MDKTRLSCLVLPCQLCEQGIRLSKHHITGHRSCLWYNNYLIFDNISKRVRVRHHVLSSSGSDICRPEKTDNSYTITTTGLWAAISARSQANEICLPVAAVLTYCFIIDCVAIQVYGLFVSNYLRAINNNNLVEAFVTKFNILFAVK